MLFGRTFALLCLVHDKFIEKKLSYLHITSLRKGSEVQLYSCTIPNKFKHEEFSTLHGDMFAIPFYRTS